MPSAAEIGRALLGAGRLALLDRNAMRLFDLSHRGVWRSFWAAALCYPGFVLLLWLRLDDQTVARSGLGHIFLVESIGYVIGWTAFPLAVFALCRWLGREEEGFDFIVAYNWSQLLQTLFFLVLVPLATMFSATTATSLDLTGYCAMLLYEWYIALVAIGAGGGLAAAIVFIDIVLGNFIIAIAANLY